jgi:O-antigen/teichoic acid export membrane protein
MSAAPAGLRGAILSLGAVNALDLVLQAVQPILLARMLDPSAFGEYRALWLVVGTVAPLLGMMMPASLYYFLPRAGDRLRYAYLMQAAVFLAAAGAACAAITLAIGGRFGIGESAIVPGAAFAGAFLLSSLLDVVFNAEQRNRLQAAVNLCFAIARFAAVTAVAAVTGSIAAVVAALLGITLVKALATVAVVARRARAHPAPLADRTRWRAQLTYAAPFGLSQALYLLRGRLDQWLVASMHSAAQFGAYSLAALISPIQGVVRSTVNQVVMPELNRLQAESEGARMLEINRRANVAVALLMLPSIAYLCTAADDVIGLLFPAAYADAATVMRLYGVILAIECIEVSTLMAAYRQGAFMLRLDAIALPVALAGNALGLWGLGTSWTATGTAVATIAVQAVLFARVSSLLGVPLARLQAWRELGGIAIACGIASAAALAASTWASLGGAGPALRVPASATAFVVAYWAALKAGGLSTAIHAALGPGPARLLRL